jgi:hypothetical protein
MKSTFPIISLLTIGLFFASCNDDSGESSGNSNSDNISTEDLVNFVVFDLRPYEINASLMIHKEETADIKHQLDTYEWDLTIGEKTYISIYDWGTKDGLENYLEKLENHPETVEFIEKEENFILYTLTTGTSKTTYHAAAQHKIDGINYLFESNEKGLSKEEVRNAVISVKNVNSLK